ncbi:hypothetical protein CFC21_005260, partial [Triticum aestivum]
GGEGGDHAGRGGAHRRGGGPGRRRVGAVASGCTQTLIGMSPCLNYITGNETAPSKSCCSQLATVVSSRPECLCVVLNADPVSPELLRPESRGYLMVIFALSSLVTHALTSAAKDTHEILEYYLSRGGN